MLGLWLCFEDGQELKQPPCLGFRQQFYNPSSGQLFVTGPNGTGVTVVASVNTLK